MKICVITNVHNHDDNRVYYKEVMTLVNHGYQVVYAAPGQTERSDGNLTYVNVKKPKSTIKRLLTLYSVYKQALKLKCDIYHLEDMELVFVGLLLKRFTKAKVIFDVHEDYPAQMRTKHYLKAWMRRPLESIVRYWEKKADRKFDAIIVADERIRTHYDNSNTYVIHNYPSIEIMNQGIHDGVEKKYDIIFPGSMAKFTAKLMIDVVKECHNRGEDISCAMISPFDFDGGIDWIRQKIDEYGLDSGQFFLSKRLPTIEIPKYIQETRIGMIPLPDTEKMRSNIPTKLFEYMYCRIPVLTGDLPPSAQYMKDEQIGYLLPVDSVTAYTDKVLYLLHNPELRDEMGKRGRNLVVSRYNWKLESKKLIEVYRRLCDNDV